MPRKISVLIPCYNAEKYIGAAIESVLEQDYPNLELVVVDDGSTDGSASEIAKFKDPRIISITQENAGHCAAANAAYELSSGDLIKFFDADDVLMPDMLKIQAGRVENRVDAIAMGEWDRFYESPEDAEFPHRSTYIDAAPNDWLIADWIAARPMTQCGMFLIPRPIIDQAGLWDVRLTLIDDFEFFTRVLLASKQVLFTPGAKLAYRSGITGSISGRKSREAIESQALALELGVSYLLAVDESPDARLACANLLQMFEYEHFPYHSDLRRVIRARVERLGGSEIEPVGPPGLHLLRRFLGWRTARRFQRYAGALGINRASVRDKFNS